MSGSGPVSERECRRGRRGGLWCIEHQARWDHAAATCAGSVSERKSVTREDVANATILALARWARYGHADKIAAAIFAALPATPPASETICRECGGGLGVRHLPECPNATPPASETVDAAWEALAFALDDYADERLADQQLAIRREVAAQLLVEHRPRIEAAIRAESDETVDALLPTFEVGQVVGELQPGRRPHDWCSIHGDIGPMESIDGHAHKHHGSSAEDIRKARKVIKAARAESDERVAALKGGKG